MEHKNRSRKLYSRLFRVFVVALVGLFVLMPGWLPILSVNNTKASNHINAGNTRSALAASDPVIAAAGDIACDPNDSNFNGGNGTSSNCRQLYTSNLLVNAGLAAVINLGDNQYYCGSYQAYLGAYDLSWGRVKSITHPSVGNHEYLTSGATDCNSSNANAAGYFQYFGTAAGNGYYSFNIGNWHLISLDTNCSSVGGCGSSSTQGQWLNADLNAHTNMCTLAFWHIPLFSSGGRANNNSLYFWQTLYSHHADVVLDGHDHIYERFAPQTPSGVADPVWGIREFTAGTGGADHTSITTIAANSEVRNATTYGVLKLTLHASSYDWQFVPEAGKTFTDSGTANCHTSASATTPTATPSPTQSPSSTPTLSPSPTASPTPISSPTSSPTPVSSPTSSPTPIPSPTPTTIPDPSPTVSATPDSSPTPTPSSTPSPTPSSSPTPSPTPVPSPTPTSSSSSVLTFTPSDDTYVQYTYPNTNYGTSTQIVTDYSPIRHMLLKFTVSGVGTQTVTSAKLRLYCVNGSTYGGDFHRVADNTWSETSVTWNTAPASDSTILAQLGSVAAGKWYEIDLTSLITGDGTYSLMAISNITDGAYYSSKEGTNPPQLVVQTGP